MLGGTSERGGTGSSWEKISNVFNRRNAMKEKIWISCQLQQMAEHEVLSMIPAETLQRIRTADPHPEFRVFSLGHEGEANANVLGMGMRVLHYAKDIIVQMFNRVKFGLPTFNRHDPNTNSHTNREVVGEVVGKTLQTIQGVLHTLAAVYIKPEYRGHNLDIASVEGNFEAEEGSDGSMGVVNLSNITGIALSNHKIDTPGMPGATLQAALQMFTQKYGGFQQMAKLTKEEIKAAILESGLKVEDVFTVEEIVASEPAKKGKQTEYEWAKRIEAKLGESREENAKLQGKIGTLEAEKATLAEKANMASVKDSLKTVATERKLDPKFTAYIEKNLTNFKSAKTGDEFKAELEKFVDTTAKDYVEMGKIYGFEAKVTTEAKKEEGKAEGNAGVPAADGKGGAATGDDKDTSTLEDPKNNDFIPA
jgi:hypothetical protein